MNFNGLQIKTERIFFFHDCEGSQQVQNISATPERYYFGHHRISRPFM